MADREKVIQGLEMCIRPLAQRNCFACPYSTVEASCIDELESAALELLKEQDIRLRKLQKDKDWLCKEVSEWKHRFHERTEIIRCADCVYWQDNNDGYPHIGCKWREDETPDPYDFCSAGERKKGGEVNEGIYHSS